MFMQFICYSKCSTCKKAKDWLNEHKIKYNERDIKENNPTYKELKSWWKLSNEDLKKFFNTSGLVYKNLNLKEKLPNMSDEEKLKLLASDGMLVKRPLLIDDDKIIIGFKKEKYLTIFSK